MIPKWFTGGVAVVDEGSCPVEHQLWRRLRCLRCRALWRIEEQEQVGIGPPRRVTAIVL